MYTLTLTRAPTHTHIHAADQHKTRVHTPGHSDSAVPHPSPFQSLVFFPDLLLVCSLARMCPHEFRTWSQPAAHTCSGGGKATLPEADTTRETSQQTENLPPAAALASLPEVGLAHVQMQGRPLRLGPRCRTGALAAGKQAILRVQAGKRGNQKPRSKQNMRVTWAHAPVLLAVPLALARRPGRPLQCGTYAMPGRATALMHGSLQQTCHALCCHPIQ